MIKNSKIATVIVDLPVHIGSLYYRNTPGIAPKKDIKPIIKAY